MEKYGSPGEMRKNALHEYFVRFKKIFFNFYHIIRSFTIPTFINEMHFLLVNDKCVARNVNNEICNCHVPIVDEFELTTFLSFNE